mmetsp:Transcript_4402/g.11254  ORF Transcript_4402/g.11254 Transcript_4402/m.11254 type:complete len:237 (+) Transcript_4402:81-791(+)
MRGNSFLVVKHAVLKILLSVPCFFFSLHKTMLQSTFFPNDVYFFSTSVTCLYHIINLFIQPINQPESSHPHPTPHPQPFSQNSELEFLLLLLLGFLLLDLRRGRPRRRGSLRTSCCCLRAGHDVDLVRAHLLAGGDALLLLRQHRVQLRRRLPRLPLPRRRRRRWILRCVILSQIHRRLLFLLFVFLPPQARALAGRGRRGQHPAGRHEGPRYLRQLLPDAHRPPRHRSGASPGRG